MRQVIDLSVDSLLSPPVLSIHPYMISSNCISTPLQIHQDGLQTGEAMSQSRRILLLGALWELLFLNSTGVARAPILDLLLLLLHNWRRVSLESDLLPFGRGLVGFMNRCHEAGESFCRCGLEGLGGQLDDR